MSPYSSVVFDLDGTLVDSSRDIANALNSVLAPRGARALTAEEVVPLLGEGVARLVEEAIALSCVSGATATTVREVAAEYLAQYRRHPVVESELCDGVADALGRLAETGVPMAVCTNKSEAIAHEVLQGLGIGRYFGSVVGGDRIARSKPHPEHLTTALTEIAADAASSVLVGDSTIDQRCAVAARVDFLAVPWAPPEVDGERLRSYADLPGIVAGALT